MQGPNSSTRPRSLRLIGDFELRCDGQVVDVPPTAQRVIALLALHRSRQVRRTVVSGTLWPDTTDQHASARLRTAIWRAPVDDKSSVVGASHTHLWLLPDVQVDLHGANALAEQVLNASTADETVQVDEARSSFTDDLLVDWGDLWVIPERERFRQLRLHVLDGLCELLLRAQRHWDAVQFGLAAVAAEPLRESAQRLLVRAHLCEGNLAEAVRQYRSYTDLLARELQVRPSAAMEELVASALADATTSARSRAPAAVPTQGGVPATV